MNMRNVPENIVDRLVLERARDLVRAYFAKERELLAEYERKVLSFRSEWDDEEGYGLMCTHISETRKKSNDLLDVIEKNTVDKINFQIEHILLTEGLKR